MDDKKSPWRDSDWLFSATYHIADAIRLYAAPADRTEIHQNQPDEFDPANTLSTPTNSAKT